MPVSLLTILTVLCVAVGLIFVSLVAYRSLIGMKEEDTLMLSAAESKLEQEQKQIQIRLNQLQPYIRWFGWSTAALLVAIAGIWVYRGVKDLL